MIVNILIAIFSAMIAVAWIHPRLVAIAIKKNLVDSPDERKLQRVPVPVLGGVAVFFGIVLGITLTSSLIDCMSLMSIVAAMMIMLYAGTLDDMINLPALQRLAVEIGVVVLLIFSTHQSINDFHGLWDTYWFGPTIAVPLTIFAAVGIINSMNLIDGVNGLSSGYCIMACLIFGTLFYLSNDVPMLMLAAVSLGSLLPFFFHNVFGEKSKMFIGDGGALVMGIVMSTFVVNILASGSAVADYVTPSFGLIPFVLAVMSLPVIDTIRVMATRMFNRRSPFAPDKTHIHHLFIELGFSHSGTTIAILSLNCLVVVAQLVAWYAGCSIELQLYIVIALGATIDYGMNYIVNCLSQSNIIRRAMVAIGRATHFEDNSAFRLIREFVDRSVR